MGGGVSRLDETLWEEEGSIIKKCNNSDGDGDGNGKIADGGLDPSSRHQTIDGALPTTRYYQNIELRKTHIGQREYEVVDSNTKEVLYWTKAVPGTLAWFDVLGPASCGDKTKVELQPSDYLLRVRAMDHLRKTWVVYRYHHPCFEGQQPIDANSEACRGWDNGGDSNIKSNSNSNSNSDGVFLYKTACLAISWSRYVAISARYGPPEQDDWDDDEDEDGNDAEDENDAEEARAEGDGCGCGDKNDDETKEENNTDNENNNNNGNENNNDDDIITPREMLQLQERQLEVAATNANDNDTDNAKREAASGGGVEESKTTESDSDSESDYDSRRETPDRTNQDETDLRPRREEQASLSLDRHHRGVARCNSKRRSPHSISQTKQLRSYFGDTQVRMDANTNTKSDSVSSKLKKRSSSWLLSSKKRLAAFGKQDEATATTTSDEAKDETRNDRLQCRQQKYELAMEGVLDLDRDQPIVQCQEISNKMIGNHQTFNMTKEDLLALLKLETEHQQDEAAAEATTTTAITSAAVSSASSAVSLERGESGGPSLQSQDAGIDTNTDQSATAPRQSWFSKLQPLSRRKPKRNEGGDLKASAAVLAAQHHTLEPSLETTPSETQSTTTTTPTNISDNGNVDNAQTNPEATEPRIGKGRLIQSGLKWLSSATSNNAVRTNAEDKTAENNIDEIEGDSAMSSISSPTPEVLAVTGGDPPDPVSSNLETSAKDHGDDVVVVVSGGSDIDDFEGETELGETDDAYKTGLGTPRETNHESPSIEKESSAGDGVEESKEEVSDRVDTEFEEKPSVENGTEKNSDLDGEGKPSAAAADIGRKQQHQNNRNNNTVQQPRPPPPPEQQLPLVSYFFWKHTSMNLGKHKMHMHLSRHSDLALHLVFAIVANQVRSERNHTVFLATGLHPSWFYIDPRNPRATIS
jgi:hypothetical protein